MAKVQVSEGFLLFFCSIISNTYSNIVQTWPMDPFGLRNILLEMSGRLPNG